jgi:hypothetical protein
LPAAESGLVPVMADYLITDNDAVAQFEKLDARDKKGAFIEYYYNNCSPVKPPYFRDSSMHRLPVAP